MKFTNLLLGAAAAALAASAFAAAPGAEAAAGARAATAAYSAQDAKTFTHEAAGVTFDLPAGWKAEPDGEQVTVTPDEGDFSLVFWVPEGDGLDASKALGEELAKQIQDLKFDGEPKSDKHNGMDHASVTGSGKINGKNVVFSADILEAKKTLIVLTVGSLESIQKHATEFAQLVKSIKRVG